MKHYFLDAAREEFLEEVNYYEKCELGLGELFRLNVQEAVRGIGSFPNAYPLVGRNVRRCLVARFPHAVLYVQTGEGILIIAVMHTRKSPGYWKKRLH